MTLLRRQSNEQADAFTDAREAFEAYELAKTRADDYLAQAIAARALAVGWPQITDDYLSTRPAKRAEAAELADIARAADIGGQLLAGMMYSLIEPTELGPVSLSAYEAELPAPSRRADHEPPDSAPDLSRGWRAGRAAPRRRSTARADAATNPCLSPRAASTTPSSRDSCTAPHPDTPPPYAPPRYAYGGSLRVRVSKSF